MHFLVLVKKPLPLPSGPCPPLVVLLLFQYFFSIILDSLCLPLSPLTSPVISYSFYFTEKQSTHVSPIRENCTDTENSWFK